MLTEIAFVVRTKYSAVEVRGTSGHKQVAMNTSGEAQKVGTPVTCQLDSSEWKSAPERPKLFIAHSDCHRKSTQHTH